MTCIGTTYAQMDVEVEDWRTRRRSPPKNIEFKEHKTSINYMIYKTSYKIFTLDLWYKINTRTWTELDGREQKRYKICAQGTKIASYFSGSFINSVDMRYN